MSDLSAALAALANKEHQPVSVASEPQTVEQLRILTERVELLEASGKPSKAHSTKPTTEPTAAAVEHLEAGDDTSAPQPEELAEAVTEDLSKGLTGAELAARLNLTNPNTVNGEWKRKQADPPKFHQWSRERDPQGIAWERRGGQGKAGKYYPLSQIVPDSPG